MKLKLLAIVVGLLAAFLYARIRRASIGTKSVLFGAHAFFLHPFFVAAAWWQLYGFPWDPRLWVAFFVHDLGYVGKPNMDGPEGELHPYWGATLMGELFGGEWYVFTLAHSRFLCKQLGLTPSRLCIADKLAGALEPWWLYLPRVRATGEIREYMRLSDRNNGTGAKYASMHLSSADERQWHRDFVSYVLRWVDAHKDGGEDTWTPDTRVAATSTGVHQ